MWPGVTKWKDAADKWVWDGSSLGSCSGSHGTRVENGNDFQSSGPTAPRLAAPLQVFSRGQGPRSCLWPPLAPSHPAVHADCPFLVSSAGPAPR